MTEPLNLDEIRQRVAAHYEGSWPYQPMADARDLLAELERVRALPEHPEMVPTPSRPLSPVPHPPTLTRSTEEKDMINEPKKTLVLHIEVPGIYADDLPESAAILSGLDERGEPTPEDYLYVVVEEWMRQEVGLTVVTLPGEKNLNEDFEVHAYTGRIVGAEVRDRAAAAGHTEGDTT